MLPGLSKSKSLKLIAFLLTYLMMLSLVSLISPEILRAAETYSFVREWPEIRFSGPGDVAADTSGNVYVADGSNHRIQKFDPSGTFLGKWGAMGTGDGEFNSPRGISVDADGNVYVADSGNNRIQKFDPSGTFLGKWGGTGPGWMGSGSGDGEFVYPHGISVDADGNVYVTDTNNNRIQKFDPSGTFLGKWGAMGTGDGEFNSPQGISVDADGNVYVADSGNNRIQKFDSSGTFLGKWGSSGTATAEFYYPTGISVDVDGNVYVADTYNNRIQKFDPSGTFLGQWGGTGPGWRGSGSGDGEFYRPRGISVDVDGNVYVADTNNNRIQKFDPSGTFLGKWGAMGTGDGEFVYPHGISVDADGNVYVADTNNNRIQKFDPSGTFLGKWGGTGPGWRGSGSGDGEFYQPHGISVDADGNVFVADTYNNRIQKFDSSGTFLGKWGSSGTATAEFYQPHGISVDADGNVYVTDTNNNRIQKFNPSGTFLGQWGGTGPGWRGSGSGDGEFYSPHGISVDANGNVYIADTYNHRIQKFDSSGGFISVIEMLTSLDTANSSPSAPNFVAIDDDNNIFVTTQQNAVLKYDSSGNFMTKWGSYGNADGRFNRPAGIDMGEDGHVYVVDSSNNRVQEFSWLDVDPTGRVTDEIGNPLANALVLAYRTSVYNSYWNSGQDRIFEAAWATNWTKTDANGEYVFNHQDLPPSAYKFRVVPPSGYVSEWWQDKGTYGVANSIDVGTSALQVDFDLVIDNEPPTGTIMINNGDTTAPFQATTLTLTATDTIAGVSRMRFRVDDGAWGPLEPYESIRDWMFSDADGPHSIAVQFVDKAGNFSEPISASVEIVPVVQINISNSLGTSINNGTNVIRVLGGQHTIKIEADPECPADEVFITGLPGGRVDLVKTPPDSNHWEVDITVTEEVCLDLTIVVHVPCDVGNENFQIGCIDLIDPSGYVTDQITGAPVVGAVVTLYRLNPDTGLYEIMDPEQDDNHMLMEPDINPQLTANDGYYGWDVAPGTYYISVHKNGYADVDQSRIVVVPPPVTDLDIELFDIRPPGPPLLLGAAVDPFEIDLSWGAVSDPESGIDGYTIIDGGTGEPLSDTSMTSHTFTGLDPGETYNFFVRAYDKAGNVSDPSNLVSITTPLPTTISFNGDTSAQYSDPANLTALLTDVNGDPVIGKEVEFTLGTQVVAGTSNESGLAQAAITIDQSAGTKALIASFGGDDNYIASSSNGTFEVTLEDITLEYLGETISQKNTTITLRVQLSENDLSGGDLSGKDITFTITDGTNSKIVNGVTDSGGVAETSLFIMNPPGLYDISAAFGGDQYFESSSSTQIPFVIWEPGPHISGGGWLLNEGEKANFGFTARYQNDSNIPQGQLEFIDRSTNQNIHAEAFNWLVINVDNLAMLQGPARINGQSGHFFTMIISDVGTPGKAKDRFELYIDGFPTPRISGLLAGGNIIIH